MMRAMQVRHRINSSVWSEWQWLDEKISWTYSEPTIKVIGLEFRWQDIPESRPTFTKEEWRKWL